MARSCGVKRSAISAKHRVESLYVGIGLKIENEHFGVHLADEAGDLWFAASACCELCGWIHLLSGNVNWLAVVAELKVAGYNWLGSHRNDPPVPFYKHALEVLIQNTSRAMDALSTKFRQESFGFKLK